MAFRGWLSKEILSPRGMWSAVGIKRKGQPSRASLMQNARIKYNSGFAASRPGTSSVGFSGVGAVTAIHNWITPGGQNLVLIQDGGNVKVINQTTNVETTLLAGVTSYSTSFADLDIWDYFCGFDTNSNGTQQVRIYDGTNVNKAFAGPITLTAASATNGGAGQCTAGVHLIGFVFQDVTGFAGVPTTQVGGVPISYTVAADYTAINISVTLPALANGGGNSTLYLIMTPAGDAANWFFIPTDAQTGSIGSLPVPANTPTTLNFVASLADEDIYASADSALPQFLLLTQATDGTGPFNPSAVVTYGTRMCYVDGTMLYVSNINNPQQVTGDQNVVIMPNQRQIGFAFPLPGSTSIYITGDRWTSYTTDNSDVPGTWPEPILVSDALGAPFPSCICFRTGGNYAWVVTEAGPYLFTGIYDPLPLTHLCQDLWNQVNWAAAYAIQVADDIVHQLLYVGVPMGTATECTNMFVIDYQNGMEFNEVDISLDVFSQGLFTALGVVKELPTAPIGASAATSNLWIGKGAAGTIARLDPTTPNDEGLAINSYWECGLIISAQETLQMGSSMCKFTGADLWARAGSAYASGLPYLTVFGPDRAYSLSPPINTASGFPITAFSQAPGIQYSSQFYLSKAYNATMRFGSNAVGCCWELSGMRPYYKKDLFNR